MDLCGFSKNRNDKNFSSFHLNQNQTHKLNHKQTNTQNNSNFLWQNLSETLLTNKLMARLLLILSFLVN